VSHDVAPGEALFIPDGDAFVPTELSRGGWSDEAQHGGPPAALMARAIEGVPTVAPMQVVRMTIDLMREVPLSPLTITTRVVRDGRRIQLVECDLRHGDTIVGRASALKIRSTDIELPHQRVPPVMLPPPLECEPFHWGDAGPGPDDQFRYHVHGIEIRTYQDSFATPGAGLSWFRLRHPVVAGEEPSDLVRVAAIADMGNGNSQRLDGRNWLYINPDITLYLHALPATDWIGMRSDAVQHPTGIGLAATDLFDERGPIGIIAQAQLIEPR